MAMHEMQPFSLDAAQAVAACTPTPAHVFLPDTPRVGALVSGTVRRLEGFGAFIGLDDAGPVSGLLHVSNISRQRVDYPEVRQSYMNMQCKVFFDVGGRHLMTCVSIPAQRAEQSEGTLLRHFHLTIYLRGVRVRAR